MISRLVCAAVLLAAATALSAQTVPVANPSFEEGTDTPAGWTLSGGEGAWLETGAAARRAVAVVGKGQDSNYWRSGPLPLEPSAVYRLRFHARSLSASGGTPVTGPAFCNRDLGSIPEEWRPYESIFVTPRAVKPEEAYLRFGQWEVAGTIAFDAVELVRALPIYARQGDLALGEGEMVRAGQYTFDAPFRGQSRNHSRPLISYAAAYNSDRWVFSAGSDVVYCHRIAGRKQTAAEVSVSVTWYAAGELVVEAAGDGKSWQPLGTFAKVMGGTFTIPAAMLPADALWVRLRAQPKTGDEKKGASLQVGAYGYKAALAGDPVTLVGQTQFLAVARVDPRLKVVIDSVGEGLPGGDNTVVGRVINTTGRSIAVLPTAAINGKPPLTADLRGLARDEQQPLTLAYAVPGPGSHTLRIQVRPDGMSGFDAQVSFHVADLYDCSYGEVLPAASAKLGLWWCSSGWKISRTRPAPEARGDAMVIRAARNETEAAQLVVRPGQALRGFTARAEVLDGPGGAAIPAENVEILRVRYVSVTQPTDSSGTVAQWPDPLPPMKGPIDLEANQNQPLWVRVKVPRDAKPGTYTGMIRLTAQGYAAEAPIRVEVYDFALPDRMTCQTAFGFSPENVWRYQKLEKPEDRRTVLAKYLATFSAHHISPYEPAPLDPIKVTWPKRGKDAKPEDLVPQFDWSAWDAAMQWAIGEYHFNTFMVHVPGMGGGTFHERVEPEFLGFKEDTPEYKAAFANYCRALQEHLRQRGWLREAYIYWFDEPDKKDYAFVMNGFRKLKAAAPDIRRMLTEQVEPELVGGPNLWCPITPEYNHERAEERRKAGEEFWWYVCCGPKAPFATLFLDHPATELRVWLWQTWQRRIDGILVWSVNYWSSDTAYTDPKRPQNPYEDPMSWVAGYGVAKGVRQAWGNGDGRFLYPPEAAADASPAQPVLDGPVDTIRWEMLRDGIEDYEYLVILRRLLAEKGGKLSADDRAKVAALLEVPPDITRDMTTFTRDPAPIERRRNEVARAIEALSKQRM